MLLDEVSDLAAPSLGEFDGVAGGDDLASRVASQKPRHEQHARISALGRPRRESEDEPVTFASLNRFQFGDDDLVMRRRFVAAQAGEFS